jgi:hypothetical protein
MWSVGGLFGWFWESPGVAARGGGGLSAGYSPQLGYSQLSYQIPLCTPCPTSAQGYGPSGPLRSRRKTAAYGKGISYSVQTDARTPAEKIQALPLGCKRQNRK